MLNKYLKTRLFLGALFLFICGAFFSIAFAQDIIEEVSSIENASEESLFSETIQIISRSGKTFILTNTNQLLNKGDFITMILNESSPIARAVVAKNHDGLVGVKILKVYSLKNWKKVKKGFEVQIIKGDDSFLFKPKVTKTDLPVEEKIKKIETEEDLFNDKGFGEDLDSFYKDNRHIKPDNFVTAGWARYTFTDTAFSGDVVTSNHFNFTWAYQFADNYWLEGLYGRSAVDNIPWQGKSAVINNYTFRFKYTFKAPLYSYILPYIGFQAFVVDSPEAGQSDDNDQNASENELINSLEKPQIAVGATLLRRLVPGWFLRVDLGNDIQAIGFGIEF